MASARETEPLLFREGNTAVADLAGVGCSCILLTDCTFKDDIHSQMHFVTLVFPDLLVYRW